MVDRSDRPLIDIQANRNAVSGQLLGRCLYPGVVAPLGNVRAQNFQFQTFKSRTPEYLAFLKPGASEGIHQHLGFNVLVALNLDIADGGSFTNRQDKHTGIPAGLNVGEKTGPEQRLDRISQLGLVHLLANIDRERGKNSTRRYPLQAFHLNIRNSELISKCWLQAGHGYSEANGYT